MPARFLGMRTKTAPFRSSLKEWIACAKNVCMTGLAEIEAAIEKLPRQKFFELVRRLRERHADEWDQQIEEDARSGRLQKAYNRLQSENLGQRRVALDKVLDDGKRS
jgi:hypothetical protein